MAWDVIMLPKTEFKRMSFFCVFLVVPHLLPPSSSYNISPFLTIETMSQCLVQKQHGNKTFRPLKLGPFHCPETTEPNIQQQRLTSQES
jgi:hypothetical protein